ncbi:helix-hairpin-helix domain-containing protein [Cyclobacterium sp. 1_MG-2023]|uniref:ComEA family DNA-binding protein n=1 Tax=Cyclobacterium sp. 1_MG-2023 TaxID=3062681 RepID=UPI0026E22E03|nr:helix-hairpin-helix domain-containing protein [Cyclobacterium sp. 1_MG-2023]MDO6438406.1 helix-hairpin-helix domain-containing protein [Cyclobacterium sp. 1_MG-2023]
MLDKWFYRLKSYLGFTRREMRGFVFVIPILALLYAVPYFIERYNRSVSQEMYLKYIAKNKAFFSSESAFSQVSQEEKSKQPQEEKGKGGANVSVPRLTKPSQPVFNQLSFAEVSAIELQMVQGVGPVLSARISEYRDNLGGFHRPEQLLEVYGVDAALAEKIYTAFTFEPRIISKININQVDFKQLIKHPYIDYGATKVILAYRDQHGAFGSAEDLLKIKIFNRPWVDRIAPYLSF